MQRLSPLLTAPPARSAIAALRDAKSCAEVRAAGGPAFGCIPACVPACVVLSAATSVVDRALMAVVLRVAICRLVSDETIDIDGLPLGGAVPHAQSTSRSAWMTLPPQPCARLAQCSDGQGQDGIGGGVMPRSRDSSPSAALRLAAES